MRLLICRSLRVCSALRIFSLLMAIFPEPVLPYGFVVGVRGEIVDQIGLADEESAAVRIGRKRAGMDQRIDGVLALVCPARCLNRCEDFGAVAEQTAEIEALWFPDPEWREMFFRRLAAVKK